MILFRSKKSDEKPPPEKERVGIMTLKRLNSTEDDLVNDVEVSTPQYGATTQVKATPQKQEPDGYGDYDNLPPMKDEAHQPPPYDYDDPVPYVPPAQTATAPPQEPPSYDYDDPVPYVPPTKTQIAAPQQPPPQRPQSYDYDDPIPYMPQSEGEMSPPRRPSVPYSGDSHPSTDVNPHGYVNVDQVEIAPNSDDMMRQASSRNPLITNDDY